MVTRKWGRGVWGKRKKGREREKEGGRKRGGWGGREGGGEKEGERELIDSRKLKQLDNQLLCVDLTWILM